MVQYLHYRILEFPWIYDPLNRLLLMYHLWISMDILTKKWYLNQHISMDIYGYHRWYTTYGYLFFVAKNRTVDTINDIFGWLTLSSIEVSPNTTGTRVANLDRYAKWTLYLKWMLSSTCNELSDRVYCQHIIICEEYNRIHF